MKGKLEFRVEVTVRQGLTRRTKHGKIWEAFESEVLAATSACTTKNKATKKYIAAATAAGFKNVAVRW